MQPKLPTFKKGTIIIAFFILVLTMPIATIACMGPMLETQTFLTSIPDDADAKTVIGKVRIIEQEKDEKTYGTLNKVEVITALKGLKKGQTLNVSTQGHSCARGLYVKPEQIYFIAGDIDENNVFNGEWRGLAYKPYWKPEQ